MNLPLIKFVYIFLITIAYEDYKTKKILPLLVVGVLVLGGLGATATPGKKSDANSVGLQYELKFSFLKAK